MAAGGDMNSPWVYGGGRPGWEVRLRWIVVVLVALLLAMFLFGCTARRAQSQFHPIGVAVAQTEVKNEGFDAMMIVDAHTQTLTVAPVGDGSVVRVPFDDIVSIEMLRANNPEGSRYVPVLQGRHEWVLVTLSHGGVLTLRAKDAAHAALVLGQTGLPISRAEY